MTSNQKYSPLIEEESLLEIAKSIAVKRVCLHKKDGFYERQKKGILFLLE